MAIKSKTKQLYKGLNLKQLLTAAFAAAADARATRRADAAAAVSQEALAAQAQKQQTDVDDGARFSLASLSPLSLSPIYPRYLIFPSSFSPPLTPLGRRRAMLTRGCRRIG